MLEHITGEPHTIEGEVLDRLMEGLTGMPSLPVNPGTPVIPCGDTRITQSTRRHTVTVTAAFSLKGILEDILPDFL